MKKCYELLDWPKLPEDMEQRLVEWSNTAEDRWPGSKMHGVQFFNHFEAPDYLVNWVKENLPLDDSYTVILQRFFNIDVCPIHKDYMRDYSFNYLLVPSDAETHFYNDDKELIHTVKYDHRQWHRHESKVYHNVTGINNYRLAIAIFKLIPEEIYKPQYMAAMKKEFDSLSPEVQKQILAAMEANKKGA